MFYRYEIKNNGKENILYLYLNMAYEFSRELALEVNHDEITRRTKNFIKSNNINYDGSKVYLVIDGIVVKTLDINNLGDSSENIKSKLIYSNDEFLVTLKFDEKSLIEITLREYLLGTLASNMIANIEVETLKALSILYRTYAFKQMESEQYIDANSEFVKYKPISYYKMVWIDNYNLVLSQLEEVINDTDCMFISHNNKYILPFVHLCNGGQTYSHIDYPYLKSVKSLWDLAAPYYIEIKNFNFDVFNKLLKCNLDSKGNIKITEVDYKGFVQKIEIGDKTYTGEEFKKLLGLNSLNLSIIVNKTFVRIITRGFGNCLGLSIFGANELAKNNCNYINILFYYFNNIKINRYIKEKNIQN